MTSESLTEALSNTLKKDQVCTSVTYIPAYYNNKAQTRYSVSEQHKRLLRQAVEPHTRKADRQKHKILKGENFVFHINQLTILVQMSVPQKKCVK